jgi:hypothetical protein
MRRRQERKEESLFSALGGLACGLLDFGMGLLDAHRARLFSHSGIIRGDSSDSK